MKVTKFRSDDYPVEINSQFDATKTASWCLISFQFLAYGTSKLIKMNVVFIFSPKYFIEVIKLYFGMN